MTPDAGHRTVIQNPAAVAEAPSLGAQFVCVVPISQVCMLDAVSIDGQDHWYGEWSPMTLLGRSPRGLVMFVMLVSCTPRWRGTVMCQ